MSESSEESGAEGDDLNVPDMPAPSPSPWERQSQLGRQSQSNNSLDSDSARPPSYNYVMKKGDPPSARNTRNTSPLVSPANTSTPVTMRGDRNRPEKDNKYVETSC